MTGRTRRGGGGAALAAALSLAACQHLGVPAAGDATPPPAAARPASLPSDPVLAFVAAASPGQATRLDDPARGSIEVRLEREYYSADGVVCRRFTVAIRQDIRTRVACRAAEGWQLDAILGNGMAR